MEILEILEYVILEILEILEYVILEILEILEYVILALVRNSRNSRVCVILAVVRSGASIAQAQALLSPPVSPSSC